MKELEYVLNKIVEIDSKATQVKKLTDVSIGNMKEGLEKEIKRFDDELIDRSKKELEKEYLEIMEESQIQAEQIIQDSVNYISELLVKYEEVKEELKQTLLNEIIESY